MKEYGKPPLNLEHYFEAKQLSGIYQFDSEEYKKSLTNFE